MLVPTIVTAKYCSHKALSGNNPLTHYGRAMDFDLMSTPNLFFPGTKASMRSKALLLIEWCDLPDVLLLYWNSSKGISASLNSSWNCAIFLFK